MVKQLYRMRQREDETRQTAKLIQFQEAQPSIDRRIEELTSKKDKIKQADYICELSEIAKDMHELGGRRAAHATIYSVFRDGLQHLPTDKRLQIGLDLLRHAIESNNERCALELVGKLDSDFFALPADDVRKAALAKLRISAFDTGCAYDKSTAAIEDAMEWADGELRDWLSAELSRMKLLQGDFIEDGKCNA